MCSRVVLLVSSQSGSCGVPRARPQRVYDASLLLLWRQNRVLTFQTPLIFPLPRSHPLGSPRRSLALKILLLDSRRCSAAFPSSLSLAPSPSVLISLSAASEQARAERRPRIPGSGPDRAELGAAEAAAEAADPGGGNGTPAQGGGSCAWRR